MSLTFKKYERTADSELTDAGTLASLAGAKSKLAFIKSNLRNLQKRVAVVIEKENGESAVIACAKSVSDTVREALKEHSAKVVLGALAKMHVLENEEGMMFISPEGGALEFFAIGEIKKETTVYEDLVAF